MATYGRPGVYINELPLAAGPIQAGTTASSASAVIASFAQGPDTVTRVTSWYEFTKLFGGYNKSYPATFQIGSFFNNGGTELYVKRIIPYTAKKKAKATITSEVYKTVTITGATISSTTVTYTSNSHGLVAGDLVTITGITAGTNAIAFNISGVVKANPATNTFSVDVPTTFTATYGSGGSAAASKVIGYIAAKSRGIDGNNIRFQITKSKGVHLDDYYDISVYLESGVADWSGSVTPVFSQSNAADDLLVEQFLGVTFADVQSGDYVKTVLDFNSAYITLLSGSVTEYDIAGSASTNTYTVNNTAGLVPVSVVIPLTGAPTPSAALTYGDYTGDFTNLDGSAPATPDFSKATVYQEFEVIDQPLVFFLPDVLSQLGNTFATALPVYNTLIDWADYSKKNFVIVETETDATVNAALGDADSLRDSSRAAVYYPQLYIKDPVGRSSDAVRKIGPSGAVAGLFMSTDQKVGPFKVAAGIDARVVDAIALEKALSPSDLDNLNSGYNSSGVSKNAVNAIRNLPGAGIVVMGGRTLKQDGTANRYINMRRSLVYIEKRLNDLLQFAVFENNTETLWARINTVLTVFLNEYRNQGGLRGTTSAESFFVKCDDENNSASEIAAGKVHVEVGVALEYPAEFVILNLSQKTAA
ncbi:Phage tail sheath C-terminal domain containing protein [uncultured Caudovirales phage]|uniref:Phage tail sheath C-terminal domain containing protein n=1 Tax=uncultured Caudovirales phage TaxID=2100421 RepID=A0A6J5L4H4_9CAUD|nr:Phage tail sheath C-terminal domain containing protein [uncultured Caudovirales phage]CAB5219606.1 Phage tail sheath C-terminal domain containing protein [uncultured Caudovirales phage]